MALEEERRRLLRSFAVPLLFVFLLWVVKLFEIISGIKLSFLGIYPQEVRGLIGIVTGPLIHGDLSHLLANSAPLLVLGAAMFYFYREITYKVFFLLYFMTGLWVWVFARPAFHIGASSIIYGLATFIFISGLIRRNKRLMALALVVAFLYGSLVWGIFPEFFPEKNISWEGHLMGILAGLVLAVYFRKEGPQRERYRWEEEEEEEEAGDNDEDEDDDDDAYWKTTISDQEMKSLRSIYRIRRRT